MAIRSKLVTVRDQLDSLWQSVVEEVADSEVSTRSGGASHRAVAASATADLAQVDDLSNLVRAAHEVVSDEADVRLGKTVEGHVLETLDQPVMGSGKALPAGIGPVNTAKRCAHLALQLAKAKVLGTESQIDNAESMFAFSACDPFWAKCIQAYVERCPRTDHIVPYREGLKNVLDTPLAAQAKIALLGDWGTGTLIAKEILKQIKQSDPDILIHLGDVYYSGTKEEMQERFVNTCESVFEGGAKPVLLSLAGNHDMYSGGVGYYWLVDHLKQKASYFAIQNENWIFIAMDTGVHDFRPTQIGSAATFLNSAEAAWVRSVIANRGNKKVVLLSHHPLFSAFEPIAGTSTNENLLSQLGAALPDVCAWFWGHEHRLAVYDSYRGLARGRCLGHGAVPVFTDDASDPKRFTEVPLHLENDKPIQVEIRNGMYMHGYAIIQLNGADATVSYYQEGDLKPVWSESF